MPQHVTGVTRRAALGLTVAATAGLLIGTRPAAAADLAVGDLTLSVPDGVAPAPAEAALGLDWQWRGRTVGSPGSPRGLVLVRADLATTEPAEVLGLLLASGAAGLLPNLRLTGRRSRDMTGGIQTRVGLSYALDAGRRYGGEVLIATRDRPLAGLVVGLTDGSLPASFVSEVLDSVRWGP